jgi:hypothetical protein
VSCINAGGLNCLAGGKPAKTIAAGALFRSAEGAQILANFSREYLPVSWGLKEG